VAILRTFSVEAAAFGDTSGVVSTGRVNEVSGLRDDKNIVDLICGCADFLKTKPGRAPWCCHIEKFYHAGMDVESMTEDDNDYDYLSGDFPRFVNVTLKVHPGIILTIYVVEPIYEDTPYRRAYIHAPGHDVHEEFVGMLTARDGRWTLRTLLMEWLAEKSYAIKLGRVRCKSQWHRGALPWEFVIPEGYQHNLPTHMANLADILVTGKCRTCNSDDGVPDV